MASVVNERAALRPLDYYNRRGAVIQLAPYKDKMWKGLATSLMWKLVDTELMWS